MPPSPSRLRRRERRAAARLTERYESQQTIQEALAHVLTGKELCVCGHEWRWHFMVGCMHQIERGGPFCTCQINILQDKVPNKFNMYPQVSIY